MAKLVLTNANISIGGTDVSANVAADTLTTSVNPVETTAFGSTAITRVGGLKDNSITLSMHQDYSAIEGLVYPLIGTATTIIVFPNGTSVGTTNPRYTCSALVVEWSAVNGAVGDLNTVDVTWPITGEITKAVA